MEAVLLKGFIGIILVINLPSVVPSYIQANVCLQQGLLLGKVTTWAVAMDRDYIICLIFIQKVKLSLF